MEPETLPQQGRCRLVSRRILAGCTVLLSLGILTVILFPTPGLRRPETPAAEPVPGPPAVSKPGAPVPGPPVPAVPPPDPEAASEPPEPLPPRPQGEPSRLVVNGDRSCPRIAFTYDAGSAADGAAAILDVLKKHGITATFFLTGRWVEHFPDMARRIAAEGHEIGNHTYSHPDLTKLPHAEALQQIRNGEAAIRHVTGRESRPLFREPYGAHSEEERRRVREAGFSYSIYWDVDTLDWQFPPVETLVKRLTEKTQGGSIVLMHLNVPDSAVATDRAVPILREKGFQVTTVTRVVRCD